MPNGYDHSTQRREEAPDSVELAVSARKLLSEFNGHADEYGGDYPVVLNNKALLDGITKVCKRITKSNVVPKNVIIYITETNKPMRSVRDAEYVIVISDCSYYEDDGSPSYSIVMLYQPTREIEGRSDIDMREVSWSSDNMMNTEHPKRTQYYIGFIYMLCDASPGFDEEPMPEYELTGTELLELGIDGELPPEMIDISLEPPVENDVVTDDQELQLEDFEYDDGDGDYELPWDEPDDSNSRDSAPTGSQAYDDDDDEAQREVETNALLEDMLSTQGTDDDNGSAGFVHNSKSTQELDDAEAEYNDLLVNYDELFE